jgi:hypothetical protein
MMSHFKLPARFAFLTRATVIIASPAAATSAKSGTTTAASASGPVRLRFRLVDRQRAAAQITPVQGRNGGVRFRRTAHFHESETARAPGLPIGHESDFFNCAVAFENLTEFSLGGAVGKITDVKVLHCISSLSKSSKVIEGVLRFDGRPSGSRGSAGVHSCTAIGFAETGASVAFDFFVAAASNSRLRFLRAMFCFRSR